ncbi:pilin [Photobacterium phosphoreum]|uniref:pilin n=1 Tax=Photobacterium phosphoreum TaxID=659 RepID=UPI000D15FFD3|nr:pilin [Photobacterium phosphoreum]PSU66211.1 pilin [Photobacterium phosphoreum]
MKKQQGFTLIELMIVVAVIGVLSAIAVPKYQEYVKKAALGTALASVSAYKTDIEDKIAFSGSFPTVSAAFGIGTIASTSAALSATNTVIATITEGSAINSKVTLTRNNTVGTWECKHNANGISMTGCDYSAN